jgi:hypothetical protein
MAITKYADQNWSGGTPIDGEKLSANGYYTGQHKGMPTQDALAPEVNNDPYYPEHTTVRFGTITQDAASNANMPKIGVIVSLNLTNCTSNVAPGGVPTDSNFNATITADEGYELPVAITVTIGGKAATASTDYTWTSSSGTLTITSAKLTGDVDVTVAATAAD